MDLEEPEQNNIKPEALEENEMEEEDPKDDEILKRNEIKNQRTNYTINEKLKILKEFDKIKNQRELSRRYNIPLGTLAGWSKNRNALENSTILKNKSRLSGAGRKSDSHGYDEILINFIKEGRENVISITSTEVICKAIEIIPNFDNKSYNSLHNWFKKFREKNFYSIRKVTKIAQTLPKNFLEKIREYILNAQKDVYYYNTDIETGIIANIDETPKVLEPITNATLEKIGTISVKIKTFGKTNQRLSCILCVF